MTERWEFSFVCLVLFLHAISCNPVDKLVRVPRNEVQYSNGTVVGSYSFKDNAGNPIAVKYYADKTSYGVELNSFKTLKVMDSSTIKEALQNPKPVKDYMEPMKPLLDLAAEILNFDHKINKAATIEHNTTKLSNTFSHLEHESKLTKMNTPDYEKYYQNEVKAPKQCEKDKVRVYLAKEKRKKKNAIDDSTSKTTTHCGKP